MILILIISVDIDLIYQYSVATNNFSSYLAVMAPWGEPYTVDIIPYAAEIRFVKLEENNRKYLSYVIFITIFENKRFL